MSVSGEVPAGQAAPARAWMDVRKGRVWTGVRVPVELSLRDDALVLRVATIRLDKKQRSALVRLCGDDVLSTLIAEREEPEITLSLATARFRYPSFPGLGRTSIGVQAPERPPLALSFVDPSRTGDPMSNPLGFTGRLFTAGPAARRTRDAWKAAIEAAAMPQRGRAATPDVKGT